jgi:hypothetical protein
MRGIWWSLGLQPQLFVRLIEEFGCRHFCFLLTNGLRCILFTVIVITLWVMRIIQKYRVGISSWKAQICLLCVELDARRFASAGHIDYHQSIFDPCDCQSNHF